MGMLLTSVPVPRKGREPSFALLIAGIALVAFVTEYLLMYSFEHAVPTIPRWAESLLDALAITFVTVLALYTLLFRPYLAQVLKRRASEERYRFLFDASPVGIEVATRDGTILACNRAMHEILGNSLTSGMIFCRESFVEPEGQDRLLAELRSQGQCRDWEARFKKPDGTLCCLLVNVDSMELEGQPVYLTTARDVTRSQQSAEELRKLASAVEQTADSVVITALDGTIEYVNPAFERLTGFSREEALGSTPRILKSGQHDLKTYETLWQTILAGQVYRHEFVNRKKSGELFYQEATITPLTDARGRLTHFVNTSKDITARKLVEEKNRVQVDRIRALRSIDQAIASSLDLRLTLNVVIDHCMAQLGVSAVNLLLLNPHTLVLEESGARGFLAESRARIALRMGEGHAGRSALEQARVHVPDLRVEPEDSRRAEWMAEEGLVDYHAVPLLIKGQVKGVLEVFHRASGEVDEDWLGFLEALAGQAAIAIDSAHSFSQVQRSNLELAVAYDATLEGWVRAIDLRDRETEGHTQRVTELTMRLAATYGLRDEELVHIRRGALLHDIGKIAIPDSILLKPARLTEEEFEVIKRHPVYAFEFLSPIRYLRPALDIPYCHHEKWDGSGYPRGLAGLKIPLAARIFSVVDVWDALRSARPYHDPWPAEKVREHVLAQSGKHFDPDVVQRFLELDPS
ncbi:MAG: PAS domain S-box protein [Candidatus Eremiobacterota bacterium]